ncbi:sensor histidine kinase [Tsuneonella sp. HG249]
MHFDDRLATVLRHRAAGERAAKTQFRQLLDLLGNRRTGRDESMLAAAWLRLAALGETIAPYERAEMIREPGLRFRNPELALHLAEDEPEVAAAALGVAQLLVQDWDALIPRLPIRARGFLRLRRDLPLATQELLERLGIGDRGLPRPESIAEEVPIETAPQDALQPLRRPIPANDFGDEPAAPDDTEIATLVRRIEAFRKHRAGRGSGEEAPLLPLGEANESRHLPFTGFAFTTDAEGRIDWADATAAPMVVGAVLPATTTAGGHHLPLTGVGLQWDGAPAVSGDWVIDAAPRFSEIGGRFVGYAGRFRRPSPPDLLPARTDPASDRMRQLLHELKTPVNAIQGFAEVIQQQLFGPTPHEYRALAASIVGDAARMLAGFDELDRLAKLESGALAMEPGNADWMRIVTGLAAQLDEVLRPRGGSVSVEAAGRARRIALDHGEAEALGWRLLATLAGAAGPGERIVLILTDLEGAVALSATIPASLAQHADPFETDTRAGGSAVSAGMFGPGFALRLARAEARAAGGELLRDGNALVLTLPRLTVASAARSPTDIDAAHG